MNLKERGRGQREAGSGSLVPGDRGDKESLGGQGSGTLIPLRSQESQRGLHYGLLGLRDRPAAKRLAVPESWEGLKVNRSQSLGWLQRPGSHPSQSPWQRAGTPCREGTVGNPGPRKGMGYGPPFGVPGSSFS